MKTQLAYSARFTSFVDNSAYYVYAVSHARVLRALLIMLKIYPHTVTGTNAPFIACTENKIGTIPDDASLLWLLLLFIVAPVRLALVCMQ